MKKIIPFLFACSLLAACSNGAYSNAPAKPKDIPPPTDLLAPQQVPQAAQPTAQQ